jgi:hypothetical protein
MVDIHKYSNPQKKQETKKKGEWWTHLKF